MPSSQHQGNVNYNFRLIYVNRCCLSLYLSLVCGPVWSRDLGFYHFDPLSWWCYLGIRSHVNPWYNQKLFP